METKVPIALLEEVREHILKHRGKLGVEIEVLIAKLDACHPMLTGWAEEQRPLLLVIQRVTGRWPTLETSVDDTKRIIYWVRDTTGDVAERNVPLTKLNSDGVTIALRHAARAAKLDHVGEPMKGTE